MQVAVLLSPGVTAFEALGPYGVFRRMPGASVHLLADAPGRVPTQGSKVALLADAAMADHPSPDVVVVPGGLGIRRLVDDRATVDWVAAAHEHSRWTTAVSTGSVLLAAAGALAGDDATTHWLATDLLEEQGAHAVSGRVVRSGRVLTAEGAVAAIEMALDVVSRLTDPSVAANIRRQLDVDELGPLDPRRPARPEALAVLGGPDAHDDTPAYVLAPGPPPGRGRRPPRGRIELLATPA